MSPRTSVQHRRSAKNHQGNCIHDIDQQSDPLQSQDSNYSRALRKRSPKAEKTGKKKKETTSEQLFRLYVDKNGVMQNGRVLRQVMISTSTQNYQIFVPDQPPKKCTSVTRNSTDVKKEGKPIWAPSAEMRNSEKDDVRNVYLKTLWRQYRGHVKIDDAFRHLMDNEYDLVKTFRNIDQLLRTLPEPSEGITGVQVDYFRPLMKDQKALGDVKAKKNGRRYSPADLAVFYHLLKNRDTNIDFPNDWNNKDPMVQPVEFEQRWSCSNCMKRFRNFQNRRLCLICITYEELTGGEEFPADDVHLYKEEQRKLDEWNRIEEEKEIKLTREEMDRYFVKREERKLKRWRRGELYGVEWEHLRKYYIMDGRKIPLEKLEGNRLAQLLRKTELPKLEGPTEEEEDAWMDPIEDSTRSSESGESEATSSASKANLKKPEDPKESKKVSKKPLSDLKESKKGPMEKSKNQIKPSSNPKESLEGSRKSKKSSDSISSSESSEENESNSRKRKNESKSEAKQKKRR
ncbi:Protein CBG13748 [Caenorhabditis briggsae]|uniref:Protein CBG13748 n=3 Tax=Caenorhabditis briggsae TaxID=6238 RepID=A8XIL5_CAEBR|nr:Protein CBG13748 [Caenorhabditis briggsae]ULT93270.1 hypothetical protein L3Y34_003034 [Caenorhabditis briggsae]CAP32490.2 Protein CBG13748 [Caenorhabditis briggsae]